MPMGWAPLSWRPFSMLVDMTLPVAAAVPTGASALNYTLELYPSGGTPIYAAVLPFITLSSDTLTNQQFEGTLRKALTFQRSIVDGSGFGGGSSGYGELEIENSEGRYDTTFQNNTIDGRPLVVRYGQITLPDRPASYNTYPALLAGIALDWHLDNQTLRIEIRDNTFKLEVPACSGVYSGAGGVNGAADMAGKRKPRAFGQLTPTSGSGGNVTPALIDPTNRVYQVNDGAVSSIPDVYDSGYALEGPSADYASYAALIAAAITDGHFATCLALGLFCLGAPADGEITCDVLGDSSGSGYVNNTATIVRRLISLSATQIDLVDEGTFLTLAAAQPAVIGFYLGLDDSRTVKQCIDELMRGIGGWSGFRQDGTFEVGRLTAPAATAVDSYITADIVADTLRRLELPDGVNPPPKRQRVSYANNWTVQPQVRGGVDATRREMLSLPHSVASHSDTGLAATIAAAHLLAQDPDVVQGFFAVAADAVAEADRLLSLHGSAVRSLYVFTDKSGRGLTRKIGETILLTYPRFDLASGKLVVVVGINNDTTEGTVEITVWG